MFIATSDNKSIKISEVLVWLQVFKRCYEFCKPPDVAVLLSLKPEV